MSTARNRGVEEAGSDGGGGRRTRFAARALLVTRIKRLDIGTIVIARANDVVAATIALRELRSEQRENN